MRRSDSIRRAYSSLEYFGLVFIIGYLGHVGCQSMHEPMPKGFDECLQLMVYETSPSNRTEPSIFDLKNIETQAACLQQILWKNGRVNWADLNVTDEDVKFMNSLTHSLVSEHHRTKRTPGPGQRPPIVPRTGFRIRREYRRLTDRDRFAYHETVNILKRSGRYDTFANVHRGSIEVTAHGGPNFLGWHRVYLALYEEALRRINWRVSLPYWDSSLDFYMDSPINSIIWSSPFLGNGDGFVTSGPFANWETPSGQLGRNTAGGSRLISKEVIRDILTRCRLTEISSPTAEGQYNLEFAHNGVHVWVGGHMLGVDSAAHDPVFFMHHAFIDYIWEMFRMRQAQVCGVDPSRDYPGDAPQQEPDRPMENLPGYRNIDGLRGYWTRLWYGYERSPSCSPFRPFCGTPYLRCDAGNRRCVSVARRATAASGGFGASSFALPSARRVSTARAEARSVQMGPSFIGPPTDGRTSDVGFGALM